MMIQRGLLACGVLASLLYFVTDFLASTRYRGYSYRSQAVSELFAIGAPTRRLVAWLFLPFNLLVTAFSLGVWRSSATRTSRLTGLFVGGTAVSGMLVPPFFPMHRRGERATFTDVMHITLTAVLSLFTMLAMGFGAALRGGGFRLYTYGTMLTLLASGSLAAADAPKLAAEEPTPWMGVKERVNIYGYLLWLSALAVALLGRPDRERHLRLVRG